MTDLLRPVDGEGSLTGIDRLEGDGVERALHWSGVVALVDHEVGRSSGRGSGFLFILEQILRGLIARGLAERVVHSFLFAKKRTASERLEGTDQSGQGVGCRRGLPVAWVG